MAITKSAKKRIRSSERKKVFNLRKIREMRKNVKDLNTLVQEKKKPEAEKLMSKVYKAIDKAAKKGVIKKNTASRKKSRLSTSVNKI